MTSYREPRLNQPSAYFVQININRERSRAHGVKNEWQVKDNTKYHDSYAGFASRTCEFYSLRAENLSAEINKNI